MTTDKLSTGYLVLGVDHLEGDSRAIHEGMPGGASTSGSCRTAQIASPWIEAVRQSYGEY